MTELSFIEPDLNFIRTVNELGGVNLKKCMQCATCSVTCSISPENGPFPRKEIVAASWGLKDNVISSHDIWLCHQCGDCSSVCPRGVKPGEIIAALRHCAITEYAEPKAAGTLFSDPRKLPVLFIVPSLLFLLVGLLTGLIDFTPDGNEVVHSHFFSHWLVELFFVPTIVWILVIFGMGTKRFIKNIHTNALNTKLTEIQTIDLKLFFRTFINALPSILKHHRFSSCGENRKRATTHMMVLFSFVALALVAGLFGASLHLLNIPGPYSQLNPVKWLANAAGVALVIGCALMIKERIENNTQKSNYNDWFFLTLLLGLGITGLIVEITRLANAPFLSYLLYFIHLLLAFNLMVFLPFSKLSHLVYRTVSITYDDYIRRNYSGNHTSDKP